MIVTHKIKMDVQRRCMEPHLDVVCGDAYTRKLELTLYSGSEEWAVPADALAGVRYARADGYGGEYDTLANDEAACTIKGNVVTAILAPEVLSAPGFAEVSVVLIKGEKILGLFAVGINVKENPSQHTVEPGKYVNWRSIFMPQTEGAKVGQYLQITEVDAEGRVIKVKPVDAPSGGYGGGDLDMKGCEIDNVGTLSFAGPDGTAASGAWLAIEDVVESDDGVRYPILNHYTNDQDASVVYRNIAPGVEDRDAANVGQLKTRLIAPIKAAVGQYIRITAVDENGAVTAVEAVDAPSGGGGADEVFAKLEDGTVVPAEVEFDLGDKNTPALVVVPGTAKVGQTIVVKAVDENGKPTEWEAVDLPSGGVGAVTAWKKLRSFSVPDDPTTDTTGITWITNDAGGVIGFEFDADEDGDAFECSELSIITSGSCAAGGCIKIIGDGVELCAHGSYQNTSSRHGWGEVYKRNGFWRWEGAWAASMRYQHDNPSVTMTGYTGSNTSVVDKFTTLSITGTSVFNPGYKFDIWGR